MRISFRQALARVGEFKRNANWLAIEIDDRVSNWLAARWRGRKSEGRLQ